MRVSLVLDELSRELRDATRKSAAVASPSYDLDKSPLKNDLEQQETLRAADDLYRNRRRWERVFGSDSDLLGDPALDILLYLFIATQRRSEVCVSAACYAANAPQTTGLRYIAKLQERGFLVRVADPFDRRRHILEMTEVGEAVIRRCLAPI